MKADDLKKALKQHVSSAEWTDKDTWAVLNRVRKEKTRSGSSGVFIKTLAVAAAFVIMFVGVLAGTGHLGLTGRPDNIQTTTEPIPLAQRKITPETELYYIPEIGEYYHLNSNCTAVSIQHKPMQAHFTWAEVNNEAYRGLQPCSACGAPMRPALPAETAEPSVTEIPAATAVPATELPETGPDITEVPETNAPAKSSEALDLYKYAGFSDGTAKITKLLKDIENADIPAELNGYKVVSIGPSAFSGCASLKTVTIPEGVTSIEPSAFSGCENLASVTLPASLVKVEAYSFANCPSLESFSISPDNTVFAFENHALINKRDNSLVRFADPGSTGSYEIPGGIKRIETEAFAGAGLSSVTIPDTVTSIRAAAFMCCSNLTGIVIPEGVTEIQQQAFMSCSALESISLPNSLTSVNEGVFAGCTELASIDISPDHPVYETNGPVLIDRKKKTVVSASSAISGKYEIPDGLHNIRSSAFTECSRLTEVIIPDGLTSIGEYAFTACSGLKEITVPASVSYIGEEAFNTGSNVTVKGIAGSYAQQYCEKNSIRFEEIDSVSASEDPYKYTVLEDGTAAITGADENLVEAVIPAELNGHQVTEIRDNSFAHCGHLTSVKLPEGVKSIERRSFANCTELRTINIPDSVAEIGEGAFSACWSLESIDISSSHPVFAKINNMLIKKGSNTVIIHTTVNNDACVIPDGITGIGEDAFNNSKMSSVVIPDSVKEIAAGAFDECRNLKEVVIPDSVKELGSYVFMGCHNLKAISIPAGTTMIGIAIFNDCYSLTSIEVSPDNPVYEARGLLLIEKESQKIICASCAIGETYEIPDGIRAIAPVAFQGCNQLKEITIPASVTSIDSSAFNAIDNLVIKAPAGSYAQQYCKDNGIRFEESNFAPASESKYEYKVLEDGTARITDVTDKAIVTAVVPAELDGRTVTSIDSFVFSNCLQLTGVTLPDAVTSIGDYAFYNCPNLKSINIPDSLKDMNPETFSECSSLSDVRISADHPYFAVIGDALVKKSDETLMRYLGQEATEYEIPEGVRTIGHSAFYGSKVTTVRFPDSVTRIEDHAFMYTENLEELSIPDSVTFLGDYVFFRSGIKTLTIPAGITSIGRDSFSWCVNLTSIQVDPENPVLEMRGNLLVDKKKNALVYHLDTDFGTYEIPDGFEKIGKSAFFNSSLKQIVVPDSVKEIGDSVFFQCRNLESVRLPDGLKTIGDSLFSNCAELKDVNIPDSVKSIEDSAFSNCSQLKEIVIPAGVTDIGLSVFADCSDDLVVKGAAGSAAQKYCEENGIRFEAVESSPAPSAENLYEYTVKEDGTAEITKAADTIQDAVIPAELDGHKVTSIGRYVFGLDSSVQTVTVPEGVTAIASRAFFCCKNLTAVTLPDSLVSMEEAAIYSCRKLKNINVSPDHPVYAFENHMLFSKQDNVLLRFLDPGNTDSYEIPQGIKRIADSALEHSSFRSVTIPDTVESIGGTAFEHCANLKEIIIPDSVSWIGHQAFFECSALESIRFPDSINSIGDGAFSGCRSLTSIEISPDHPVYEVKDLVLIDKKSMEIVSASAAISGKYEVPEGILSIENDAFQSCVSLTEVVIPESVSEIGNGAFNACDRLQQITVLGSSTEIWSGAFSTCNSNTVIKAPAGSTAQKYCEENGIRFEELKD